MYRANYKNIQSSMSAKVAQATLNLIVKQGKLDKMIEITREFNCLFY